MVCSKLCNDILKLTHLSDVPGASLEASPSNVDAYIIPDASGVDAGKCVRAGQRPMLPSFVTIKEAERIRYLTVSKLPVVQLQLFIPK